MNQQNLISVIRHSLTAASAALTALESAEAPALASVEQAVPQGPLVLSTYGVLMQELNDARYKLRSVTELADKAGINIDDVCDVLDENHVDYVTRTRRSDGADLIGLAYRQ